MPSIPGLVTSRDRGRPAALRGPFQPALGACRVFSIFAHVSRRVRCSAAPFQPALGACRAFSIFAHVSRRVTVRFITSRSLVVSGSTQK